MNTVCSGLNGLYPIAFTLSGAYMNMRIITILKQPSFHHIKQYRLYNFLAKYTLLVILPLATSNFIYSKQCPDSQLHTYPAMTAIFWIVTASTTISSIATCFNSPK